MEKFITIVRKPHPKSTPKLVETPETLSPPKQASAPSQSSLTRSAEKKSSVQTEALGSTQDWTSRLPEFLRPEHIRDKQGRRPADPGYDGSTVFIPKTFKPTPAMAQYWEIKQDHFDKLVLFKLGKFYEMFYYDAHVGQQLLDLNWVGSDLSRPHVGFPEKALDKMAKVMIDSGHQVVVVEQTEKTLKGNKQQEESEGLKSKSSKTVGREITEILSKSTVTPQDNYEPNYLLALFEDTDVFGTCLCECSTGLFTVGQCNETELRTLLSRTRPSEVVYNPNYLPASTLTMLKASKFPPILRSIKTFESWSPVKLEGFYPDGLPPVLKDVTSAVVIKAVTGCLHYLQHMLVLDKLLDSARYSLISEEATIGRHMILDNRVLETTDILEAYEKGQLSKKGSLLDFLDHAYTPWGKRLLKKWVATPLTDVASIQDRHNAVEELQNKDSFIKHFQRGVRHLGDVERKFSRVSTYAAKTHSKAVYFENVSSKRLKEFLELLDAFEMLQALVKSLLTREDVESSRLKALLQLQPEGLFPDIAQLCQSFKTQVCMNNGEPEPVEGICPKYDGAKERVKGLKAQLEQELVKEKAHFGNDSQVAFVNSKFKYELEVPQHCLKARGKPSHYEETSARKGFQRFHTELIKTLVDKLEFAEDRLLHELKPFLLDLVARFCTYQKEWLAVLNVTAEIDCLCSLALACKAAYFPMCKPEFTSEPLCLEVTDLVHPVLANRDTSFIPNDVTFTAEKPLIVLTGPNMGGKSTLLREVVIAVVLAQIGCFVPARTMKLAVVDRIITRMGASDCIAEGKSTFFVEVEEAAQVFTLGTPQSLAILDEFGRGTSTEDGASLALAFMHELNDSLRMRCFFTTHYHMISSRLAEIQHVRMAYMDLYIDQTSDRVVFLFKLRPGICPSSYALNVAALAGIPQSIVEEAKEAAQRYSRGDFS